jgi:hypothetical protein
MKMSAESVCKKEVHMYSVKRGVSCGIMGAEALLLPGRLSGAEKEGVHCRH